jgi:hypothetical protein
MISLIQINKYLPLLPVKIEKVCFYKYVPNIIMHYHTKLKILRQTLFDLVSRLLPSLSERCRKTEAWANIVDH